jgi:hypothetical protein
MDSGEPVTAAGILLASMNSARDFWKSHSDQTWINTHERHGRTVQQLQPCARDA